MRIVTTIKEDRSGLEKLKRILDPKNSKTLRTGWWGNMHPNARVPTATVAAWNEEGRVAGGKFEGAVIPPRPFIRLGFTPKMVSLVGRGSGQQLESVLNGTMSWESFYDNLADSLKEAMQDTITEWHTPPNSPVTIRIKGFNDPLVETGHMRDSVEVRVIPFTKRGG